jgi:hypothetical protein
MTSIRSQFGLDFHPFLRNPNNRERSHAPRRVALSTLRPRRPCHLLPTGLSAPPPPFAGRSQHLASSPPSVCQLVPAPRCYSLRGAPAGAMTPYLISYFTQRSSVGRDIEPAVQRSLLCICAMRLLHDGCNGSQAVWETGCGAETAPPRLCLHCSAAAASASRFAQCRSHILPLERCAPRHTGSQALPLCPCVQGGERAVYTLLLSSSCTPCAQQIASEN